MKGNLHAFIGASVSFVTNDWKYVVRHLSFKLVAWHHKGTMLAEPMVAILKKNNLYQKISILHLYSFLTFQFLLYCCSRTDMRFNCTCSQMFLTQEAIILLLLVKCIVSYTMKACDRAITSDGNPKRCPSGVSAIRWGWSSKPDLMLWDWNHNVSVIAC